MQLTLIHMEENAEVEIPLGSRTYGSVRSTAYNVGRQLGRKYKVHLNREKMCCEVKRLKI